MRAAAAALVFVAFPALAGEIYLPDPTRTPGATNTAIRQDNLHETVCIPGYTGQLRPHQNYTSDLRKRQFKEWNLPGKPNDFHEDHLVPLCAGGHPTDPKNLWPQPIEAKWRDADKNQLEASVCRAVCDGSMTLWEGQTLFLAPADWTKSYETFFDFADQKQPGANEESE